jgi:LacI family transcriptional regulator
MAITITEIAEMTGVSKSAVHRALSGAPGVRENIRQEVLECATRHHYQPNLSARVLVGARTRLTALLATNFGNVNFAQFLRGAGEKAGASGYHLLTASDEKELNPLKQLGLEGVIGFFRKLDAGVVGRLPAISLLWGVPGDMSVKNCISSEVEYGAGLAIRHLLALGHRRIGFVTVSIPGDQDAVVKAAAYRRVLAEAGIEYDPSLVVGAELYRERCGYEAALKLLTMPEPPTAVFGLSDILATGCYRAARELNLRIPEDLSVCGYDDKEYCSLLYPALTTVRPQYGELGSRAMDMLIHRIEGWEYQELEPLLPALVQRDSTGPVRTGNRKNRMCRK